MSNLNETKKVLRLSENWSSSMIVELQVKWNDKHVHDDDFFLSLSLFLILYFSIPVLSFFLFQNETFQHDTLIQTNTRNIKGRHNLSQVRTKRNKNSVWSSECDSNIVRIHWNDRNKTFFGTIVTAKWCGTLPLFVVAHRIHCVDSRMRRITSVSLVAFFCSIELVFKVKFQLFKLNGMSDGTNSKFCRFFFLEINRNIDSER